MIDFGSQVDQQLNSPHENSNVNNRDEKKTLESSHENRCERKLFQWVTKMLNDSHNVKWLML